MLRLGYNYTKKTRIYVKLLEADFVLTCNDNFEIIEQGGIVFDALIIEVGNSAELREKYPEATLVQTPPNSIIMPGLINPHVHLEFSANQSMLSYGDFISWLQSVIKHREMLGELATTKLISEKLQAMLKSGTTTLGAISSFGYDLEACEKTPQRVVFFSEILGSIPSAADAMYGDFCSRYYQSLDYKSPLFIPAISVHSPYSTHPILAKKAIELAKNEGCVLSTHFMESRAEREWLDSGEGEFVTFFNAFNPYAKPMSDGKEYLDLFQGVKTLFTHGVQATDEELNTISTMGGTLTHCPVSNRLLGVGKLDLEKVRERNIPLTLGTDGLSSNISLSLWDEMRCALMMHANENLTTLAPTLLNAITCNAANALNLPCGKLEKGLYSDIIVTTLPQAVEDKEQLALQLILHTKETHLTFINGELL